MASLFYLWHSFHGGTDVWDNYSQHGDICRGYFKVLIILSKAHAIAQVVSRRFPTAAARVRSQVRSGHVEFVPDENKLGQVFSEYFGFPCQFSFHRLLHIHHHLSSIIWGWYNRPNSGRRTKWTTTTTTTTTTIFWNLGMRCPLYGHRKKNI
jgi:hypothetical protein